MQVPVTFVRVKFSRDYETLIINVLLLKHVCSSLEARISSHEARITLISTDLDFSADIIAIIVDVFMNSYTARSTLIVSQS